jgi:hypothetical protein
MKTKILNLVVWSILLLSFGCTNEVGNDPLANINYPVNIATSKISLQNAEWKGLKSDSAYVINSKQELLNYISFEGDIPEIDFDKNSLLVVRVGYCNTDSKVDEILFQQLSLGQYQLNMDVTPSFTSNTTPLVVSLSVPKLSKNATTELVLNKESNNDYLQAEGYIVGYETCGVNDNEGFGSAVGYIVITADLKDTLSVYNMPQSIYNFPENIFRYNPHTARGLMNDAFPEQFRYAYKIQFSYTLSSSEEIDRLGLREFCTLQAYYEITYTYKNCIPVIIKSAIKSE